jgi:hypothetical protein
MPKNNKPAPPQQSNLAEMWGKKREPNVKEESTKEEGSGVVGDVQVNGMEVDIPVKPESSMHFEVYEPGIYLPACTHSITRLQWQAANRKKGRNGS